MCLLLNMLIDSLFKGNLYQHLSPNCFCLSRNTLFLSKWATNHLCTIVCQQQSSQWEFQSETHTIPTYSTLRFREFCSAVIRQWRDLREIYFIKCPEVSYILDLPRQTQLRFQPAAHCMKNFLLTVLHELSLKSLWFPLYLFSCLAMKNQSEWIGSHAIF